LKTIFRSLFLFALVTLLVHPASAQKNKSAPEKGGQEYGNQALIDNDFILKNALVFKDIRGQLRKYESVYRDAIKKEEKELRRADEELARQRTILSPEAFNDKRKQFQERLIGLQKKVQRSKQVIAKTQNEAIRKVEKKVNGIIAAYAKEKNIVIIFRKNLLVFAHGALDISKDILKRLDKAMPSLKVPNPESPETKPKKK